MTGFSHSLDLNGVASFFQRGYVAAPLSIWKNIKKVMPATRLTITFGNDRKYYLSKEEKYWSVSDIATKGQRNLYSGSYESCKNDLKKLLVGVLEGQSLSDVPLGVFLSGGVDSSIITALMEKTSNQKLKLFTALKTKCMMRVYMRRLQII